MFVLIKTVHLVGMIESVRC